MASILRSRGRRLAILALIEHEAKQRARRQSTESLGAGPMDVDDGDDFHGEVDPDFADFATDFDEVELSQKLHQIRDEATSAIEQLEMDETGNLPETAQDQDLPTVDELWQLADFQNVDDDPTADETSEEEDVDDDDIILDSATLDMSSVDPIRPGQQQEEQPDLDPGTMGASRKVWDHEDTSETIPHHRNLTLMSDFHMALGIWAQLNGISDSTYRSLREILQTQITPETLREIHSLPVAVSSLKRGLKKRLPLLEMRKTPIPLSAEKLSSIRRKCLEGRAPVQDLHFFNPVEYMKTLLMSDMKKSMYFGMALLVDEQDRIHPWHSKAWASSARSTSGQFAHYKDETAIIPSDFIRYSCHADDCLACKAISSTGAHVGRVLEVWCDQRTTPLTVKDAVVLLVEPLVCLAPIKAYLEAFANSIRGFPRDNGPANEYIMVEDQRLYVAESHVIDRVTSVHVDYTFGSAVELDQDAPNHNVQYLIRRKVNIKFWRFFPVVKSAPIRGELEVEEFTRQAIVESLDRKDVNVYTVSLILFADGFGLYRTMHKSIMGIYLSIASLKRADRHRQMNVMPITMGPHSSNDDDVWIQIGGKLRELEEGFVFNLHGEPSFASAHVMFLAGDSPQQQDNSGFRRPTAKQGCRMCDVTLTSRGDLNFDLTSGEHERYHHEILRQRASVASQETKKEKEDEADNFGLAIDDPALTRVLPALDIIRSRPPDSAHSELGGLTKMLHLLIYDQVLTPIGGVEYCKVLRLFPRPTGWGKIQSPHHVLQYSLTEHARWSVMGPLIMRTWLKSNQKYIKVSFLRAIMSVFEKYIQDGLFGPQPEPADIIIRVLVENVRSNILLTTDRMGVGDRDRQHFDGQLKRSRRLFQLFCKAASEALHERCSKSKTAGPAATNIPTVASGTGELASGLAAVSAAIALRRNEDIEDPRTAIQSVELTTAKSTKYHLWMSRPNVHMGLHYANVVDEYGLASVPMVLAFEMKHKLWKRVVYTTNHKAPERDLFVFENVIQTIRFLLLNAFADTDSELTQQMHELNNRMPSLFSLILRGIHVVGESQEDEDDDAADISWTAQHSVVFRLEKLDNIPDNASVMDLHLRSLVTQSYSRDCNQQVTIMGTSQVLKWWKKISWDEKDPSTGLPKRVTKNRGQYVRYTDDDGPRYGRLDNILTHDAVFGLGRIRAFLIISPVRTLGDSVDSLTGLHMYEHEEPTVIGLAKLSAEVVYMVPFKKESNGDFWDFTSGTDTMDHQDCILLHVDWHIGFM
ncbi:hypothetical protein F4804DRAFT_247491 [Jackrogersella minutella]|nr:hypothetical protein F4804DRAFT_247491 [Jackrogersella minutella]